MSSRLYKTFCLLMLSWWPVLIQIFICSWVDSVACNWPCINYQFEHRKPKQASRKEHGMSFSYIIKAELLILHVFAYCGCVMNLKLQFLERKHGFYIAHETKLCIKHIQNCCAGLEPGHYTEVKFTTYKKQLWDHFYSILAVWWCEKMITDKTAAASWICL